jgi:serine/threonine protein kinase
MLKFLIFLTTSLILFDASYSTRHIIQDLQNILPTSIEIKNIYEKQLAKSKKKLPYEFERTKMDLFLNELKKGLEPIGEGGFGRVFRVENTSQPSKSTEDFFAVKEIFFKNDGNSVSGEDDQQMIVEEIKNVGELQKVDPKHIFFPEYLFFLDATQEFELEARTITDQGILENLQKDDSHDVALFFMESMDWTLGDFHDSVQSKKTISHFVTRLRLFANVCTGIQKMLPLMSHCDLKPGNIMLKKISQEKSAELVSKGHLSLRLSPIEYYQVKIIDFGLVAKGNIPERNCHGGTLQYLPIEYLFRQRNAPQIDVYAIGLMIFNMEMADLGMEKISNLLKIVNYGFDHYLENDELDDFQDFLNTERAYLENNIWYKTIQNYWKNDPDLKLFPYLENEMGKTNIEKIKKSFKVNDLNQINLFEFISIYPMYLHNVLMASLELFLEVSFKQKIEENKLTELKNALTNVRASVQNGPGNTEEYQKAVELEEYYETRIALEKGLADIRLELLKYLLTNVIRTKGDRPESNEFFQYVNSILNRVTSEFEKEWEHVFQIEEHYWILSDGRFDESQESLEKYLSEHGKESSPFDRLKPRFILL